MRLVLIVLGCVVLAVLLWPRRPELSPSQDAVGVLAQGRPSETFKIYGTYTDATADIGGNGVESSEPPRRATYNVYQWLK